MGFNSNNDIDAFLTMEPVKRRKLNDDENVVNEDKNSTEASKKDPPSADNRTSPSSKELTNSKSRQEEREQENTADSEGEDSSAKSPNTKSKEEAEGKAQERPANDDEESSHGGNQPTPDKKDGREDCDNEGKEEQQSSEADAENNNINSKSNDENNNNKTTKSEHSRPANMDNSSNVDNNMESNSNGNNMMMMSMMMGNPMGTSGMSPYPGGYGYQNFMSPSYFAPHHHSGTPTCYPPQVMHPQMQQQYWGGPHHGGGYNMHPGPFPGMHPMQHYAAGPSGGYSMHRNQHPSAPGGGGPGYPTAQDGNPNGNGPPPALTNASDHHHNNTNMTSHHHGGNLSPQRASQQQHHQGVSSTGNSSMMDANNAKAASMGIMTGRSPVALYMSCDDDSLSQYQCVVRRQIELFEARSEDVESNAQGRNKPIVLGQVGIRCRHCTDMPPRHRARASVYYPAKLLGLYQAAQNMATIHLCQYCQRIPATIRTELLALRERKSSAGGGKKYWGDGARVLGVYEAEDGLRFT